ncbi:MAG: hypothetical protein P1U42_11985 [Phycisphaerales bacterium]|nr:hypothetical protein [Phycisphaerales bacterium]
MDKQEIIQEDRKLNREIQAGFSLEAMKHRQQLASDFAYSIPQSLQLLGKIKSLDSEVFTLLKITDNSANSVEEAEKLLNESTKAIKLAAIETQTDILNAEWRNNKNYLSVCELVGMRFEEVRPYSSSLNSCIDIFTEQDINLSDESTIPEDPSRFIQMAERFYQIRGRIPTDSFFYCNQQPKWITAGFSGTLTDFDELKESDCDCQSNPTFHIKDVIELDLHDPRIEWMKNSNREMELAYKWLRVWYVLDDRDLVCHTKTEFNEYVRKGHTQELAHRNAYDATRRALERASDVLFVETVQNIGIALEDQVAQTSFYSLMEKKPEPSSDPALIP